MTTFLIDGYNLLHAAGLAPAGTAPRSLDAARGRLLDWLADHAGGRPNVLRVVFDAVNGPGESPERLHRGVRVRFAFGQTADDLIEDLLHLDPNPAAVAVVSNDTRLVAAAKRHRAKPLSCQAFVDWLLAPPSRGPQEPPDDAKPPADPPTADELAGWLRAFGGR